MSIEITIKQSAIEKAERYAADELGFASVEEASKKSPKLFHKIYLERVNYLLSQYKIPVDATHVQMEIW